MAEVTLAQLHKILVACAGGDDDTEISPESATIEFEELGYDSLALMETAARLQREYGVHIAEEDLADLTTPQQMLDVINSQLAGVA
ncbi:acyl carrier protein [Mycobacterium sp. D16R24]|uniref:acyl carrier protein n=1 Tax=Mycobacterium sp. D16R24 TaxID=1855656 RepID=UPI000992A7B9|nr:acyl carrier protein [Mycobacterium sp. D16R24]